jgi:peptidoglycan/xylan/chitin deacetylase (PgdA/CDA1 family)
MTAAPARRGLLVLAYHAVTDDWRDPLAVTPETFRSHLRLLARGGYRPLTFSEAATTPSTRRRVAITFDDAFASAARWGAPILAELGWPATVFVPTQPVEKQEPMLWLGADVERTPEELEHMRAMTWGDVERLAGAGWEVGSHTQTHRRLSELDRESVDGELRGSRDELVRRFGRCEAISYPWGEVVAAVVAAAKRAGYSTGSGLGGRFRFGDAMTVPRVAIAREDGGARYALKTSPLFWRVRGSRLWERVERARGR